MRVGAATLAAGIFGALGTLCFFLAFGTDYWLVASDNCGPYTWPTQKTLEKDANGTESLLVEAVTASPPSLTLHHEGFFWRCVFQVEPTAHAVLATLFTNQPESKVCVHGYLFPLPVALGQVPHPSYDATAVFRGFWTVLIILGLVAALTGAFLLVCGVPFISHKLYKLGGAFLIAAGKIQSVYMCGVHSIYLLPGGKRYIYRHKHMLQPLLPLLSTVHTCHMTNRAADVTLQCCRYTNSRFKHCYRGNSRDE
uniref:Transmembrane protein 182 n=1 Tax=Dicentrarchus labrax TaxID=13489 RepID=A0A8P4G1T4_DICLA